MSTLKVEYIGSKAVKEDNVAHTGIVWVGQGDVQSVPAGAWPKLSRHPDVWRLAGQDILGSVGQVSSAVPAGQARTEEVAPVNADSEIAKEVPDDTEHEDVLYGTNHEAHIQIGESTLQLGDVVNGAFAASGMSVQDWNELSDQDRFDFVEDHIGQLRSAAAQAAGNKDRVSTTDSKADAKPAAKRARAKKGG